MIIETLSNCVVLLKYNLYRKNTKFNRINYKLRQRETILFNIDILVDAPVRRVLLDLIGSFNLL